MSIQGANEEHSKQEEAAAKEREEARHRVAKRLTAARKKMGLSVEDVAGSLKLLPEYLHAFDSGDWNNMPEEVYTLGFLRQYARFVGIDVNEDIERLKSASYHLSKPVTVPEPPTSPTRKWAMISAALFVALFALFNLLNNSEEEVPTPPPVVEQPMETGAEKAATVPAPPAPATAEKASEETPQAEPQAADMHHYTFTASGKAVWLQVFSPSRKLIREALLQADEHMRIDVAFPELRLTCGNAAALQISVDGTIVHPAGSLGADGKVLRDFRLMALLPQ